MSNRRALDKKRPGLFTPKIRGSVSNLDLARASNIERTLGEFSNTNIENSSSFRYGDKSGLISTQQLPVDYSKFENHTFFHSAVAKVNEAFDKIINFYPFDGDNKEIEAYEDSLTGFENYILKKIPKNVGYLIFSGTQKGELGSNGNYLSVVDHVGTEKSSLATSKTGASILNPGTSPFSFEFFLRVPSQANDNQVIVQKISGSNAVSKNITVALSSSTSTSTCNLIFAVTSGSNHLYAECPLEKGKFNHLSLSYRKGKDNKLHIRRNASHHFTSSNQVEFQNLNYHGSNLNIGSGSSVRVNNDALLFRPQQTFSGSMDEFRYFKTARELDQIKAYQYKSLDFNKNNSSHNLLLYFKFNEPTGSFAGNNIVLDSSGNSLTTELKNFTINNRLTSSDNPVTGEDAFRNPVLFPSFPEIVNLNNKLMVTASLYDDYNPNLITKLVPNHYFFEGFEEEGFNEILGTFKTETTLRGGNQPKTSQLRSSQRLTIFLLIWAKFFDELKMFTDSFANLKNMSYDEFETVPDALLRKSAEMQGLELPQLFRSANIKQLFEGVDLERNPVKSQRPLMEIQNTIWRRILASLPYLRETKGTINSVKSVFRSSGIDPDNILLVREFGGSSERRIDKVKEKKKDIVFLLPFSGSFSREVQTLDTQGRPNKKPTLVSGFLSGSRVEPGFPNTRSAKSTATITTTGGPLNNETFTLTDAAGLAVGFIFKHSVTTVDGTKDGANVIIGVNGALGSAASVGERIRDAINASDAAITATEETGPLRIVLTQNTPGLSGNTAIDMSGVTTVTATDFTGGATLEPPSTNFPLGISSTPSDGLFTTSSFTFEGQYRFHHRNKHYVTQSLVRLHTTGTLSTSPSPFESVITNLIYNSGSQELTLLMIDSPKNNLATPFNQVELKIPNIKLFDSDLWNISFGVNSGDKTGNVATGSLFLRAGKANNGKIEKYFVTSAFYERPLTASNLTPTSVFSNISNLNTSGAFLSFGSQSLGGSDKAMFINDKNLDPFYRTTQFSGELGSIRFWSKEINEVEWKSHVRNPMSHGVNDPLKNYLFEDTKQGSFEKLRLLTSVKQGTTASNAAGGIRLFDTTQNNIHLSGAGFESNKNPIFKPEYIIFNAISPNFDLSIADEKVRVRSLSSVNRREEHPYSNVRPVYEVLRSERTLDDPRFSIEMSSMKGLNDNIVRIFSDYDFLDTSIGKTNLIFGDRYPDLIQMRKLYFNNILDELDIGRYREIFKFIDNSFTDIVAKMLPHTTKFMGINFVYENHMLERNRFRYLFDEIYLKSKPLTSDRTLLLSQFVIVIGRM